MSDDEWWCVVMSQHEPWWVTMRRYESPTKKFSTAAELSNQLVKLFLHTESFQKILSRIDDSCNISQKRNKNFKFFLSFFAIFSISQKMFEKVRNFVAILANIAKWRKNLKFLLRYWPDSTPATTEGVLSIIRSSHVYQRLQVDLKRSKPEAIEAIDDTLVATFFRNSATFFALVQLFSNSLKIKISGNISNIFRIFWNVENSPAIDALLPIYYEPRPTEQGRANVIFFNFKPRPTEQGRANLLPIYYNLGQPNRDERTYFSFIMNLGRPNEIPFNFKPRPTKQGRANQLPIYYAPKPTEQGRANQLAIYYEPRPTEQGQANLISIYYEPRPTERNSL